MDIKEIKKLENTKKLEKIQELKKEMYENKQKLIKGELKDVSIFNKSRKTIARILTVLREEKNK